MSSSFPLYTPIRRSNLDEVRRLLAAGVDLAAKSPQGRSALHVAAEEGNAEIAVLLLEAGAPVDARMIYGETPLHVAAIYGESGDLMDKDRDQRRAAWPFSQSMPREVSEALLRVVQKREPSLRPFRADDRATRERTMVLLGAMQGLLEKRAARGELLEALAEEGIAPERLPDGLKRRLLRGASHEQVIRLLHGHGADLDALDDRGETPLVGAVASADLETVELLLDLGADPHRVGEDPENYTTPLAEAITHRRPEIALLLLRRGVDPELGNDYRAPLHLAAEYDQLEVAIALCERGGDVDIRDEYGQTPLFFASLMGTTRILRELLRRGGNPHARNVAGSTLLHAALQNRSPEAVEILLAAGTDPMLADEDGQTPRQAFREMLDEDDPDVEFEESRRISELLVGF